VLYKEITVKIQNIILPVGLSGHENWSLTVWEDHRQRIFEKRVPINISGSKAKELTEHRRRQYKRELHHL
jgi:hypothetical protein